MTNMKKALIFTVFLVAATVQGLQARGQKFTISGKIDGIVKGDTLRFRRITLPGWATGQAFDMFLISGWPFFIFIGPDGKILARDFSEAFGQAKKILEEKFGE